MYKEQEQERNVVVFVGSDFIVENKSEKQYNHTYYRSQCSLLKFFEARLVQHPAIGTLHKIKHYPAQRHYHNTVPKIVILHKAAEIRNRRTLDHCFSEYEKHRPGKDSG